MSRVVLALDDDPIALEVTQFYLEEIGCEVITASNPHEALEILATNRRIEMLITDIQMDPMDGYEVAERAKRMRPELFIIFASGRGEGVAGIPLIQKPFTCEQLSQLIERATKSVEVEWHQSINDSDQ